MAKYRLVKVTKRGGATHYSVQKRKFFWWVEIDHCYSEETAYEFFNKCAIKPKIQILAKV